MTTTCTPLEFGTPEALAQAEAAIARFVSDGYRVDHDNGAIVSLVRHTAGPCSARTTEDLPPSDGAVVDRCTGEVNEGYVVIDGVWSTPSESWDRLIRVDGFGGSIRPAHSGAFLHTTFSVQDDPTKRVEGTVLLTHDVIAALVRAGAAARNANIFG